MEFETLLLLVEADTVLKNYVLEELGNGARYANHQLLRTTDTGSRNFDDLAANAGSSTDQAAADIGQSVWG